MAMQSGRMGARLKSLMMSRLRTLKGAAGNWRFFRIVRSVIGFIPGIQMVKKSSALNAKLIRRRS